MVVGEGLGARFLAPVQQPGHARQEGYDWGGLTSDATTQPLWVLLLPFSLMNVAGWTYPAVGGLRATVVRGLVHVCSGLLTAIWTCWLAIVVADLIFYQRLADRGQNALVWAYAGVVVAGIVMFGIGWIAGRTITTFEATDVEIVNDPPTSWEPEERLTDKTFFAHALSVKRLLLEHRLIVLATLIALWVRTRASVSAGEDRLGLGAIYRPLATAQGIGLILLAIVGVLGVRRAAALTPERPWWHPWLAVLRPFAATALALSLTTGMFSGLVLFTRDRLKGDGDDPAILVGEELDLVDGSFVVLLVWVVVLAIYVGWYWVGRRAQDLDDRRAGAARPLDGAEVSLKRQVGRARRLARACHGMANVLTLLALLGMGLFFGFVVYRFGIPDWVPWLGPTDGHPLDLESRVARGAAWFFPLLTLFIVGLVQRAAFGSKTRRTVGILWDVLSFWPRRFHPFAIRPYAERAVPEFQARVLLHLGPKPPAGSPMPPGSPSVLISAHSQGSIIAAAALAPLVEDDPRIGRVALLTYGCPLRTLYESAFSAYFSPQLFVDLRSSVAKGPDGTPLWVNLWRRTDPIGGPVFAAGGLAPADLEVLDPATGPPVQDPVWQLPDAEPLRTPWVDIAGHSHFHGEETYKAERQRLCSALAPPPPGG